ESRSAAISPRRRSVPPGRWCRPQLKSAMPAILRIPLIAPKPAAIHSVVESCLRILGPPLEFERDFGRAGHQAFTGLHGAAHFGGQDLVRAPVPLHLIVSPNQVESHPAPPVREIPREPARRNPEADHPCFVVLRQQEPFGSPFDMPLEGIVPEAEGRSEERRVGKECRAGWSPYQ